MNKGSRTVSPFPFSIMLSVEFLADLAKRLGVFLGHQRGVLLENVRMTGEGLFVGKVTILEDNTGLGNAIAPKGTILRVMGADDAVP